MQEKKLKISGHQTFAFRFGWLEKGFRFAKENKSFSDEDAIVSLGVGKNMVESIKYWCEMARILENGKPTPFGEFLLGENGKDPYLEDDASLWLLHWKIVTNPFYFTSGSALFSQIHKPEFSKRDIAEIIDRMFHNPKKPLSMNAVFRDIDCYLRLYAGRKRFERKNAKEESFDSPMQDLKLIFAIHDAELYRFSIGHKTNLPAEIVGYALWEFMERNGKRESIRLQEALYQEMSPGQAFMLDENTFVEILAELENKPGFKGCFDFHESAGIATVFCKLPDGVDLLASYYTRGKTNES